MRIVMTHDGRTYAGPTAKSIVEKFKHQGDRWFDSKTLDDYMQMVATRLGLPEGKQFPGKNVDERSKAFIEHLITQGYADYDDEPDAPTVETP